jgi:hypothetical protein
MSFDEMLAALHPSQRAAVTHPARPLLLACGPGSGKTRILTHRIQWLIEHEGLDVGAILALTFSRAAADELRGRVVAALGARARALWTGTFHGFGASLLRRHATAVGRTSGFTILDREDTRRLVARLAKDLRLDGDLPTLVEALERARTPGVAGTPRPAGATAAPLEALRAAYEARCREANAFDFLDLLVEPLALFAHTPSVHAALRARFRPLRPPARTHRSARGAGRGRDARRGRRPGHLRLAGRRPSPSSLLRAHVSRRHGPRRRPELPLHAPDRDDCSAPHRTQPRPAAQTARRREARRAGTDRLDVA